MKQLVLPIKDTNILHEVEDTLLHNFREGRRNYTIFQVGKATLLRVSHSKALVFYYFLLLGSRFKGDRKGTNETVLMSLCI